LSSTATPNVSAANESQWPWADELDALAASGDHHKLLFENDRVRVLDTHIPPGERTAVHTHRWAGVLYVLSWSVFVRRDDKGQVLLDSRLVESMANPPASMSQWSAILPPHSFENVGTTPFHVISVELKDTSA
jgi:mannose-6-phosphate isomerase-like protein (cupin superfamily)